MEIKNERRDAERVGENLSERNDGGVREERGHREKRGRREADELEDYDKGTGY